MNNGCVITYNTVGIHNRVMRCGTPRTIMQQLSINLVQLAIGLKLKYVHLLNSHLILYKVIFHKACSNFNFV